MDDRIYNYSQRIATAQKLLQKSKMFVANREKYQRVSTVSSCKRAVATASVQVHLHFEIVRRKSRAETLQRTHQARHDPLARRG